MELKNLHLKLTLIMLAVFTLNGYAQTKSPFWTKVEKASTLTKSVNLDLKNRLSASYSLDILALKDALIAAPNIEEDFINGVKMDFPMNDGSMESFEVFYSPVMSQVLQNRYPELKSYVGQSVKNPEILIRFSTTPKGLTAILLGTQAGSIFIDVSDTNQNEYIIHSKNDSLDIKSNWQCNFQDPKINFRDLNLDLKALRNANDGNIREYRLALASTVEYSQFHGGTLPTVTAAMMTTITRINGVYERELSVRLIMVDNSSIIFLGPDVDSDPYTNDDGVEMLDENQNVITANIGAANYDIGHVFSTGGGGVASLNALCDPSTKARGVTGSSSPEGDTFDIDFVAHEIGHQFGSPHTFNGNRGNCAGGNRNSNTAYEPGSGSTIMAYAGICSPQNVQENSDDYFHQSSLELIWANISNGIGGNCATLIPTGNTAPIANAGGNFTIPASTPYKLTGSSSDIDGIDSHTYTWEQYDLGPAGIPTDDTVNGPMVRSFQGTVNPTRIIPRISEILQNGGNSTTWEKLPSVTRDQTFRLTVRDNDINGGQNDFDSMTMSVVDTGAPFIVTSQNQDNQIVWTPGETETITWNVAGTAGNGINESNVNILLSTSEAPANSDTEDFDIILATNVPNNGSFDLTVPALSAPYCRIMVEAANNIFFNVNDSYFAIGNYSYVVGDNCTDYQFSPDVLLEENEETFNGYFLPINDSVVISDLNISVDVTTTNNAEISMAIRGPFSSSDDLNFLQSGSNNGCPGLPNAVVTFDDEGVSNPCTDTSNNIAITPINPLSFANGEDSEGSWIFNIGDIIEDGNRARWNSVTLTICETSVVPTLSSSNFNVEGSLNVYPNPNKGEFNITFDSLADEPVLVELYDISGRLIFKQNYKNSRNFNENIKVPKAESGLYILNLSLSGKSVTKKIVIE